MEYQKEELYYCIAERTRSQKWQSYKQHFFEMLKNTEESLPKSTRKRKRWVPRVCVPKSKVKLGYDDQCEETKAQKNYENDYDSKMEFESKLGFNDSEDILEIDVEHCEEMEFEGSNVKCHEVNFDSMMNPKLKPKLDESKAVNVDDDEKSEVELDDQDDGVGLKSAESDVEIVTRSALNEAIIILSSDEEHDVTSFVPQTGKTELLISCDTDIVDPNSEQSLTSSDTDNDDLNDEDFDADNYVSCVSSSSSEECEDEDYDIDDEVEEDEEDYNIDDEVDEEENEGSDNVKEMTDTPASKRRACSGERNQTRLDFSDKANVKKNCNQLDGAHAEKITNFKCNQRDKKELWEENGSRKAEESRSSIDMKRARACENYGIKGKGEVVEDKEIGELRNATNVEQADALEVCDVGRKIFKTYERRKRLEQKKHGSSTYEVKGDKESNGISKDGKNNDKFNGDGAHNEQLCKEKGYWKEVESRKSTNTKQARVKEDNDVGPVRNNDNFSVDGVEKRDKRFTERKGVRTLKGYDIFRILADSILNNEEALEGGADEQEIKQLSSVEYTLPLKFKFEDEEPEPVEKSEFEKMVDDLFAEMNFVLTSEEMGSFDPPEDNDKTNVLEADANQSTLCRLGKHHLVLDEEIGIRCLHCSYVDLESKYVLPPLRIYTAKASERENYIGGEDLSDKLDIQASRDTFRDSFYHTEGTVWDIIPGIRESMYVHQREGFEFLWNNLAGTIKLDELKSSNSSGVGGCIISHAPGTGKTHLTIIFIKTFLKLFPNCRPVIIAPASMLLTWEEEFRKWKVEFPFHNLNNPEMSGKENRTALRFLPKGKCQNKNAIHMVKMYSWSKDKSILGVSYSLFEKLAGEKIIKGKGRKPKMVVLDKKVEKWRKMLLELPDLVVLDEGHTPRNQRSCIWNTLLKLQTERRIILSGTPFQNNFGELFNTLRLVRSTVTGLLAKEKTFADTISSGGGKYGRKQWREERAVSRRKVVDEAIERLKSTIAPFVHVHKGSILQESLPGLRDCVVLLNPPLLQKHLIERIEGPSMLEYEYKVALASVHPSLLLYCSLFDTENSIMDHNKLEQLRLSPDKGVKTRFVMELIRLSAVMNEKVLIFSQFIHPLELINDQLREVFDWNEGREVLQTEGKLDQKHRQNMINVFNCSKSDAKVLLASINCCSEGINLVGASRVVLLDVVWNPSVERQAISRAYRLGQKKVVYTYHLMTSGTTEGDKYCRQAEKDRLSELVFSSTDKEKDRDSTAVFNDKILDEMIGHEKLKDMFEKIVYQPKEPNLIESFGLGSANLAISKESGYSS